MSTPDVDIATWGMYTFQNAGEHGWEHSHTVELPVHIKVTFLLQHKLQQKFPLKFWLYAWLEAAGSQSRGRRIAAELVADPPGKAPPPLAFIVTIPHLILPVEREKETPGPAVPAEPVEGSELREIRVRLTTT